MKKIIPVVAMALFLFGCANASENAAPAVYAERVALNDHDGDYSRREPHAGQWAVAAVGTPFYLVFKTAVCGATLVVAAPAAAIIALADSPYSMSVNQLGDGVAANCGPPYVLSPS